MKKRESETQSLQKPKFIGLRFFRRNCIKEDGWELNFWVYKLSIRVGKYQFAAWWNYDFIFNVNFK